MLLSLAAAGPSAYWYLARGTGAVALVLLTAVVVLGVMPPLQWSPAPRLSRFTLASMHRDLSLLAVALLVVHIVTSVLDSFAPISLADAVIPFGSAYRPLWMGLGALAFDLLVALIVTSLLRRRLGYRGWRRIHWLAYASWPVAVLHGLGTGSDTKEKWMLALTVVCGAAVLAAVWARIARAPHGSPARGPALLLSIAAPLGLVAFALAGPLQRGWARRAGTPARLLGGAHAATYRTASATSRTASTQNAAAATTGAAAITTPFSANLDGTMRQRQAAGGAIIDMALRLSGNVDGRMRVRLAGLPLDGGGLSLTGSQVDLTAPGLTRALQGRIVSLQGTEFLARLRGGGAAVEVRAQLNIDPNANTVTGTLYGTPAGGTP